MSKILFLVVLAGVIISHSVWLFSVGILTHGDWGYYLNETLLSVRIDYFSTWLSDRSLGRVLVDVAQAPTYIIPALAAKFLDINFAVSARIVYFFPLLFFSTYGTYLFLRGMAFSQVSTWAGVAAYAFNTYFLSLQTGHLTLAVATSLAPVIFYAFGRMLVAGTFQYMLYVVLLCLLSISYEPRSFYIIAGILCLYFVYYHFFIEIFHIKNLTQKKILLPCGLFALLALLNFWWVIGIYKSNALLSNDILDRGLFGNGYWNILDSFTLHHPWWSGSAIQTFVVQPIPPYFWLVPIMAFLGLLLHLKNRQVLFWGAVGLVGIFLSKQIAQPLPHIYPWLFENFPGFNLFREASKFYSIVAVSYAVLIAAFIDGLLRLRYRATLGYFFAIFVVLLFIFNTKPLIHGEINRLFVTRNIPSDYLLLKDFMLREDDFIKILWVPKDSRWSFYDTQRSRVSLIDALQSHWSSLVLHTAPNSSWAEKILSFISSSVANDTLDVSGIKYVVVSTQDAQNDDDFFIHYGGKDNPEIRQWYISEIDKIEWLQKIDIGTKELVVYENKNYKQPIFAFGTLFDFDSLQNLDKKYSFITQDLEKDFYFNTNTKASDDVLVSVKTLFENISPANLDRDKKTISIPRAANDEGSHVLSKAELLGDVMIEEGSYVYRNDAFVLESIITNGSFEEKMWQKEVGDCNRHDDNGLVAMSLNAEEKTNGAQSLQLEATRHIACTSTKMPVKSGSSYLVSFDYQSPNADHASYYLGFNDEKKTKISEDVAIVDTDWHTFSKTIKVPEGATQMSLYVYADSVDDVTNIINRYDNFQVIEVPDLSDAFYLVRDPQVELVEPRSVEFELVNPTKKRVSIKGATTPFYLAMSESFHPEWQLQFANNKIQGFFNSWMPFVEPDRIPDEYHYKLNDFLNAWYVDVDTFCVKEALCTKNADGSYDIEMVVEFFPQRWFYLGLLISGTTLAGCLGYLGYVGAVAVRRKYYTHHV